MWPSFGVRNTLSPATGCSAAVDAHAHVDALAVDLGVTEEVAVSTQLLDDVDLDREAVAGCSDT